MDPLLEVDDLVVNYSTARGNLKAVDGVTFALAKRETLGLVGESGSGKSTLGLSLLNLLPPQGRIVRGSVRLMGREILGLSGEERRQVRGREIGMVFQDPMTSLNPVKRIGDHFVEALKAHDPTLDKKKALARAEEVLRILGIQKDRLVDYPHQLSGGMKQRVMIGLAVVLNPRLLIADEPTTALDVIIEAQILDLLKSLKEKLDLSVILITHNLGVVAAMADRIAIMYAGRIFEVAPTVEIFRNPMFPYTQLLLKLAPNILVDRVSLDWIPGSPPDLTVETEGCRFVARCPYAFERCRVEAPSLKKMKKKGSNDHWVACHLYDEGDDGARSS